MGTDALALLDAGLEVVAVEADPETASIAQANLGDRAEVLVGDAVELAPSLLQAGVGAYADPARRTDRGRSWRTEDLSPPWSFVELLLAGDRVVGVKLGPGLPHRLIPAGAEAEWVSEHGDTVEVGLWSGPGASVDGRAALLLPDNRLVVDPATPALVAGPVGSVVYEPDGAVIRAGGTTQLGAMLDARLLHPDIAYLTADEHHPTPFATGFEVLGGASLRRAATASVDPTAPDRHAGDQEARTGPRSGCAAQATEAAGDRVGHGDPQPDRERCDDAGGAAAARRPGREWVSSGGVFPPSIHSLSVVLASSQ